MPKPKPKDELQATTGLDYLGADGKFHRAEPGDLVKPGDLEPKALKWMRDAGFLAPIPSDDSQDAGAED